jgi:bacillithiol system protein YtxJ
MYGQIMNWLPLSDIDQLKDIITMSANYPVAIFKHSTSCSISSMAKMRLESSWDLNNIKLYYLDLLRYRSVSNTIASDLHVHHESPQIILIHKGEVIYDASHFDISVEEINETISYHNIKIDDTVNS